MHHFVINLIKITAHQMQDFQLDKHQKTFCGRLRPDPLGSLSAPPDPLAAKRGPTSTGRGGEEGERGGERVWRGKGGQGREGPPFPNPEKNPATADH